MRNKGAAGIDRMDCARLLGYLLEHKDALTESIRQRTYRPTPVRRVEIPKDNGKKRLLGIPTVVDRMIQQSIAQVLTPIYERQFSQGSFGFRPNRGAKDALVRVTEIVGEGYRYAVGIDLERFFDTVNHAKLIEILQRTIKDDAVVSLIHRYLNAGVMIGAKVEPTREGTPQGGPLSPLLANVLLNELDKELERRGHPFVRYADDGLIFCKSRRAAERVRDSITVFIENRLKLKVNREKTECAYIGRLKYLGYGFYVSSGKCRLRLHEKSEAKLRRKLKHITSRSNGMGYEQRKTALRNYLQGWTEYFNLADIRSSGIIVRGKYITITKVELVEAADRYDAISVTIGADGIATFSSSKHHSFAAAGITPYYASAAADGNVTLTPIADKTTWGYQGYILKGAEGTYTIPVVTSNDDATYPSGTNYLKGTDDYSRDLSASTASECRYIFAKNGSTIGFYYLNSSYTLAAHKAYLQTNSDIRSSPGAVEMRFLDAMGGTTAIQTLRSAADSSTEDCYTLSGLRVAKPTKGIYVVNGKKIIVK